ncbi:MAG: response regulator [Pirellulaceae bacterium]|nr:response regulator [Pirellulaceae bacterium]
MREFNQNQSPAWRLTYQQGNAPMGIAVKPIAVVVEDDYFQCEQIRELLEANDMQVIRCDSAEAAELVVARTGLELSLLITDVELAGCKTGLDLAQFAREQFPNLKIIVVSATKHEVPPGMVMLEKPWQPVQLLREALHEW